MPIKEMIRTQAHPALTFDLQVQDKGRVELVVPFPKGTPVAVFVIPAQDRFEDLMQASQSSLDFWDNPFDDEDWNEI